jgi:NhaP-type Na+/H+ or K+/H+ antiporter
MAVGMKLDILLAVVGVLGILVAAVSGRMRRLPVSEPMLGLLVGVLLGPRVADVLQVPSLTLDHALVHEVSRVLLAISVMAVGLRYPFADVRRLWRPVTLLLLVAMPAMAVVTGVLAWWVLGVPVVVAALLGAALAPTDPVLASNVVTGGPAEEELPARDRQLLSIESGANDGLALPLVIAAVAWAGPMTCAEAVAESVWQVAGAAALGALVGWLAGRALKAGEKHGATEPGPVLLYTAVLALGLLGFSGIVKVDGVLAVFVASLAFNAVTTGGERDAEVPIDEAVNRFAVLPLFVLIGASLPWTAWGQLGWRGPLLVVAVLLLRRIPVILLLRRPLGLRLPDALHLGWFGPIGVSAVFYLTLEADRMTVDPTVVAAGSLVVAVSTVVHAGTAAPGLAVYRRVTRSGR